jgi:hypothetical protein
MIASVVRMRFSIVVLVAGSLLGCQVSRAVASTPHPTGMFEEFADCPLGIQALEDCVFANVNGGSFTVGHKTIPVTGKITLTGGFYVNPAGGGLLFIGAKDGNTLSSSQISVPGGLTGLVPAAYLPVAPRAQLGASATAVTMTIQLARPAGDIVLDTENFIFETGVALSLPVKIKLSNPFLGDNCYIGSASNPIVMNLTSGTTAPPAPNKPIEGTSGNFEIKDEFEFFVFTGARLVDNSFAAPEATGCGVGGGLTVDRAIDSEIGLPSAAGHNVATLVSLFDMGYAPAVRESE